MTGKICIGGISMALLPFALALLAFALLLDRAFCNWQHCKRPVKTQNIRLKVVKNQCHCHPNAFNAPLIPLMPN
jgi:hypothetical protein